VRVRASGVCGRDLIDARGGFPAMKLPTVLGHEFAGEVAGVGAGDTGFALGDRVVNLHRPHCGECRSCLAGESVDCEQAWQSFGHTVDGGYAELVVAHRRALVRVPDGIDLAEAAPVACTAGVALRALRRHARLELGETLLVTGASGGVGIPALQLGKLLGARVLAVTSSASKAALLEEHGADHVIVSADGNFHDQVKSLGGADVALELTGSATFGSALRSLRRRGRLVVVGNIRTEKVAINLGALILWGYSLHGSHGCTERDLRDCFALMKDGKLRIVLAEKIPLARAADAHRMLAERKVVGRIVLLP
jgi:acryloyl-coenzyme A reductase